MKNVFVKTFMVPLKEYATVSEDANLRDAVLALPRPDALFSHVNTLITPAP